MKNLILSFLFIAAVLVSCQQEAAHDKTQTTAGMAAYSEPHRPQFHYSPKEKWTNDPNGMVYFDGEYHLFYQHYPDSSVWGPMHWAHAVSKDLTHWENLPIAIYPDSLGYIFSGSAAVDWNNTSGFGKDGQPPLVAMFTYHDMAKEKAGGNDHESQAIAWSLDRGRTWTKYDRNPVLPNPGGVRDIRDPKIAWHEASKQWVVVLAVGDHVEFWGAPDLKNWTKLSEFGKQFGSHNGVWECPDLFQMAVDGTDDTKWVLLVNINPGGPNDGSATQYFVGDFNGKDFAMDIGFAPTVQSGKAAWMDWGKDNYAGVTWSDVPKEDGRRLLIGWMSNWEYANIVPTEIWRNAMTLPRVLLLKKTEESYLLFSQPAAELQALRGKPFQLKETALSAPLDLTGQLGFSPTLSEMELEFALPDGASGSFGVELSNTNGERYRIGYDASTGKYFSDRTQSGDLSFSEKFAPKVSFAPRFSKGKTLRMHLFFDVASVELFADGGATVMTEIFFPGKDFTQVKLFAEGGAVELSGGMIYPLKSIWK